VALRAERFFLQGAALFARAGGFNAYGTEDGPNPDLLLYPAPSLKWLLPASLFSEGVAERTPPLYVCLKSGFDPRHAATVVTLGVYDSQSTHMPLRTAFLGALLGVPEGPQYADGGFALWSLTSFGAVARLYGLLLAVFGDRVLLRGAPTTRTAITWGRALRAFLGAESPTAIAVARDETSTTALATFCGVYTAVLCGRRPERLHFFHGPSPAPGRGADATGVVNADEGGDTDTDDEERKKEGAEDA
jgi:hypothetical protein